MHDSPPDLDRLIRLPELIRLTGLSRPTLYRLIRRGKFPPPVQLAENCKGWFASQVQAWQHSLKPVELTPESLAQGDRLARTEDGSRATRRTADDAKR
jgi:prophage regulatory protein